MVDGSGSGVYFILTGQVVVSRLSSGGRSLAVRTLKPGEVFFTGALLDGGPAPASLEAMGETQAFFIPRQTIMPLITHNPKAAQAAFEAVASLIRQAHSVIEGLAFKDNTSRLASLLLEISPGGAVPRRQFSLETLSGRIGTVPEIVCRLLRQFAAEGLIEVTRDRLIVVDRSRLKEIASKQ
jgi:CRP/FNR family transcriptional regulator